MKRFFVLLITGLLCIHSFAQEFNYGATAGLLLSHPKGYKTHVGYALGVKGEYSFSDKMDYFYINSSLLFASKGWKDYVYDEMGENKYDWTCNAYYIEIPIMAGYKYTLSNGTKLSLELGPYLAVGLFGNSKIDYEDGYFDEDNIFSSGIYKRFDYGLKTYIGLDFSKWQVGISWSKSFENPIKDKWKAIDAPKDITYSLLVSYIISK